MAVHALCRVIVQTMCTRKGCRAMPLTVPRRDLATRWPMQKFTSTNVRSNLKIARQQNILLPFWSCSPGCNGATRIALAANLPILFHCKPFHTSSTQRAIPPVLLIVLRPFLNFAAVVFGRRIKQFWKSLPQEKKVEIMSRLNKNKRKIAGILSILSAWILVYILLHVEKVPFTERKRVILFTHQDMRNLSEQVQDEILGLYKSKLLFPSHPQHRRVVQVLSRIMGPNSKEIVESGVTKWTVNVIDEPDIANAMVLPTGHVFVFSGIINVCSNDDQLGAVLAHEIAHVLLNHQGENLSNEHFFSLFLVLVVSAIWAVLPDFAAFLSHAIASTTSAIFIKLPFSRLMESEADTVGLNLAAKACMDVREASVFWAKMSLREELGCEEQPLELLSSHPSHQSRQKAIDELIPGALKLRESCKCGTLSFHDPRASFYQHKQYLIEAKLKGYLSCDSIFSYYKM